MGVGCKGRKDVGGVYFREEKNRCYSSRIRMYNLTNLVIETEQFKPKVYDIWITVQILCIGTDRSQQTVQTKIRLLLKKQSDQGLRCLPFHQHLLDALMQCYIKLFFFRTIMVIVWGVPNFRIFTVIREGEALITSALFWACLFYGWLRNFSHACIFSSLFCFFYYFA